MHPVLALAALMTATGRGHVTSRPQALRSLSTHPGERASSSSPFSNHQGKWVVTGEGSGFLRGTFPGLPREKEGRRIPSPYSPRESSGSPPVASVAPTLQEEDGPILIELSNWDARDD